MKDQGTILVVDDIPADLELLVDTLTAQGYQVLPADCGELALTSVAARPPDLILLDIRLPGLNGFEVCRQLKARPESRDIPVVFISASGESAERVEGLRLGAVDYITKPFQREELLARVQTHLELRRLRVQLEQQAANLRQANEQLQTELAEQKRVEEALRASQEIIEGIINAIPVRVFWKDSNLVYLGCNAVFARDAGFASPKDIIGKDDCQMGWRGQAELYRCDDRQVIESGCARFLVEEPQTTPDGNTITLLTSKIPLRNSEGKVSGVLGTYMDITDRKRMEERLRQLSRAVEQSPASIVITDPTGDIEYVNPKFIEINGYTLAEVLGKNPRVLKSGEKSPQAYRELWQTITAGGEWRGEFHNKKKNGELYWESASISPIRDLAGRTTHYVAVKEDITARKQTEAERDQLIQDLQQALANVKSLSGLLPICAGCKKIRDDKGYWSQVESYVQKHSEATFTHGLCPDCIKKYYPELGEAGVGGSRKETSWRPGP